MKEYFIRECWLEEYVRLFDRNKFIFIKISGRQYCLFERKYLSDISSFNEIDKIIILDEDYDFIFPSKKVYVTCPDMSFQDIEVYGICFLDADQEMYIKLME